MCGFLGYFSLNNIQVRDEEKKRVKSFLQNRGPDHFGEIIEKNYFFAHARLNIIDPDNTDADQPILKNKNIFVYNGEIYNYKDFSPLTSDTLFLYEELQKGLNFEQLKIFLEKLRGFYSFLYHDVVNKKIILARDVFAKKPLYYFHHNNTLITSSSLKAIKVFCKNLTINEKAKNEFFLTGRISSPNTQYEEIKQLLPGEILEFDEDLKLKKSECLELKKGVVNSETPFLDAVKRRYVADVPVGLLLSSGYDSSVILGASVHLGFKPTCFSIQPSFQTKACVDESVYSEKYAKKLGVELVRIPINEENLKESYQDFIAKMELPCIDGLNIFCVTKVIKKYVKVLLTGTGGDEVQQRYKHYQNFKNLPAILGSRLNFIKRAIFRKEMPIDLIKELIPVKKLHPIQANDLYQYLIPTLMRDGDWASMSNSVELRAPFVDQDLWALSLAGNHLKILEETIKYDLRDEKPAKFGFELPIELLFPNQNSKYECLLQMRNNAWEACLK